MYIPTLYPHLHIPLLLENIFTITSPNRQGFYKPTCEGIMKKIFFKYRSSYRPGTSNDKVDTSNAFSLDINPYWATQTIMNYLTSQNSRANYTTSCTTPAYGVHLLDTISQHPNSYETAWLKQLLNCLRSWPSVKGSMGTQTIRTVTITTCILLVC